MIITIAIPIIIAAIVIIPGFITATAALLDLLIRSFFPQTRKTTTYGSHIHIEQLNYMPLTKNTVRLFVRECLFSLFSAILVTVVIYLLIQYIDAPANIQQLYNSIPTEGYRMYDNIKIADYYSVMQRIFDFIFFASLYILDISFALSYIYIALLLIRCLKTLPLITEHAYFTSDIFQGITLTVHANQEDLFQYIEGILLDMRARLVQIDLSQGFITATFGSLDIFKRKIYLSFHHNGNDECMITISYGHTNYFGHCALINNFIRQFSWQASASTSHAHAIAGSTIQ
jgi:hypothetical protein